MGAKAEEIVFTSGGTEADNMAIFGAARARDHHHGRTSGGAASRRAVAVQRPSCRWIAAAWSIRRPCAAAIRPDTKLISVMHVNNELGVIQPIRGDRERSLARPASCSIPTACRRSGKIPVDVKRARRGSVFDQRAQNLRTEGHGRAVRAQGHGSAAADLRWSARAQDARRYGERRGRSGFRARGASG